MTSFARQIRYFFVDEDGRVYNMFRYCFHTGFFFNDVNRIDVVDLDNVNDKFVLAVQCSAIIFVSF